MNWWFTAVVIYMGMVYSALKATSVPMSRDLFWYGVSGSILGFVFILALLSGGFYFTGKLWKGKASYQQMFYVTALSFLPWVFDLLHLILWLSFNKEGPTLVPYFVSFAVWIIQIRILVYGIKVFQQFDAMRSVLNIVLAAAFSLLLLMALQFLLVKISAF